jgi:hypothetical protein
VTEPGLATEQVLTAGAEHLPTTCRVAVPVILPATQTTSLDRELPAEPRAARQSESGEMARAVFI